MVGCEEFLSRHGYSSPQKKKGDLVSLYLEPSLIKFDSTAVNKWGCSDLLNHGVLQRFENGPRAVCHDFKF